MVDKTFRQAPSVNIIHEDTVFGATQDISAAHDGSDFDDVKVTKSQLVTFVSQSWTGLDPTNNVSKVSLPLGQFSQDVDTANDISPVLGGWFGLYLKFPENARSLSALNFVRSSNSGNTATKVALALYDPDTGLLLAHQYDGTDTFLSSTFTAGSDGPSQISLLRGSGEKFNLRNKNRLLVLFKGEVAGVQGSIGLRRAIPLPVMGLVASKSITSSGQSFGVAGSGVTALPSISGSIEGGGIGYGFEAFATVDWSETAS